MDTYLLNPLRSGRSIGPAQQISIDFCPGLLSLLHSRSCCCLPALPEEFCASCLGVALSSFCPAGSSPRPVWGYALDFCGVCDPPSSTFWLGYSLWWGLDLIFARVLHLKFGLAIWCEEYVLDIYLKLSSFKRKIKHIFMRIELHHVWTNWSFSVFVFLL